MPGFAPLRLEPRIGKRFFCSTESRGQRTKRLQGSVNLRPIVNRPSLVAGNLEDEWLSVAACR
jgi:hypothetical protein